MAVLYRHKQTGITIVAALGLGAMLSLWFGMAFDAAHARLTLFVVVAVLVICAILFSSLTIELSENSLSWQFGPGIFRRKVAIAEIQDIAVTKTKFIHGWGVHVTRNGWLYNVSGFDAVQITLKSGKMFLLGTDKPAQLHAALQHTIESSRRKHSENAS